MTLSTSYTLTMSKFTFPAWSSCLNSRLLSPRISRSPDIFTWASNRQLKFSKFQTNPSPPALNLSQHQCLSQWADALHQEKGVTEDEMVGWHHRLNGYEFEQTLGDSEGQGSLACCSACNCRVRHYWVTNTFNFKNKYEKKGSRT